MTVLKLSNAAEKDQLKSQLLCPRVVIHGEINPGLNDVEKRLVCGDPQIEEWSVIPEWQARYNLKNFLQERGLYAPVFNSEISLGNDGKKISRLIVDVGVPTRVTQVLTPDAPPGLHLERKRKVLGQVLTPALLGEIEAWSTQQLKAEGYPCPEVKGQGDPETGIVRLQIQAGPQQNFSSTIEELIPGMDPHVLRRYDAFQLGEIYNGDLLTLTSQRLTRNELLDSAYFISRCGEAGAVVKQEVIAGPSRLLSFGVGTNTEGVLLGKVTWRNARLGVRASSYEVTALASTKEQRVQGLINAYILSSRPAARDYLRAGLELGRRNETFYDYATIVPQLGVASTWDSAALQARLRVGPTLELVRTFRGVGPQDSKFLNLATFFELESHYFELYRTNPRRGYLVSFESEFNTQALLSSVSASRLGFRGEGLWNIRAYDPPLMVFGVRGGANTTLTPERPQADPTGTRVPPLATYFLGGSRNLRGFGRESLPGSGTGGLTSAFLGAELRLLGLLPYELQPFAFGDAGMIGGTPFKLSLPIYYSPGLGLRWAPAFGVFRTTLARGYPLDSPGGWQFYFSFGEEF